MGEFDSIIGKKFKLKSEKVIFVGVYFCMGGLQAESVLGAMRGLKPTSGGAFDRIYRIYRMESEDRKELRMKIARKVGR